MRSRIRRWRERRAAARAERLRLSGWNPRTRTYEKGGLRPRNAPGWRQIVTEADLKSDKGKRS